MDAALIAAARSGDERAANDLYDRYEHRVRAVVARWVPDPAQVDDLCQESWLRAFRGLPSFRGDAEFGTWLHTIARNVVVSWSKGRRRRLDGLAEHRPVEEVRPEPVELRLDLQRALGTLPDGMRSVLWLHDVEGWTHVQIGEQLGVTEGTSKSQLFKARARLRAAMREKTAA
jgi:RNA polymerase sigma-70 factor (ECF subfamily)